MKVYLFLFFIGILLFQNQVSFATKQVVVTDTLNVMAIQGMWLRDSASLTSNKLVKLPYATKLVVVENDSSLEEILIQETKYFEIKGRMQKVKVVSANEKITNLEGYVFDGYLTKFPVPVLNYESSKENGYLSADLNYLQTNFENHEKYEIKNHEVGFACGDNCICSFKQNFGKSKEIEYEYHGCHEGGVDWRITIPNLSMREAYFFVIVLYFYDYEKEPDMIPHSLDFNKSKNSLHMHPSDNGAGCNIDISQDENNTLLISGDCSC